MKIMTSLTRTGFLFLLFILSINVSAQYKDALIWTSVEAETTVLKNWNLRGEIAYRINNNFQSTDKVYAEAGIQYKINKYFRVSGEYRFIEKNIPEDYFYAERHRLQAKIKSGFKFSEIRFNWTGKYQLKFYDDAEHNWGNTKLTTHIRNKFQFKYKAKGKNLYPYLYYEFFIPLNALSIYQYSFDTHRMAGGLEYEINKKNSLKLYFLFEKEKNDSGDINNYIYGIGYSFKI